MLPGYRQLPDIEHVVTVGRFKAGLRTMPLYEYRQRYVRVQLRIWQGKCLTHCCFDRPVKVPVLYSMGCTMMSPTPMEVLTLRQGVRRAKGCVMVGGFGMGIFVRMLMEKQPCIRSIIVVDTEAATWERFGQIPGITFVHGDAFEFAKRHPDMDRYLLDVWPGFGDASDDHRLKDLHQRYPGRVWGWGDVSTTPNVSIGG